MKKFLYVAAALALPLLAGAQQIDSVQALGAFLISLINQVAVPLVFALAFIVFIWGVFLYFINGGHNEEAQAKGKALMLYGLIGFFVMVSIWGLVNILTGTFNLENQVPELPSTPDSDY